MVVLRYDPQASSGLIKEPSRSSACARRRTRISCGRGLSGWIYLFGRKPDCFLSRAVRNVLQFSENVRLIYPLSRFGKAISFQHSFDHNRVMLIAAGKRSKWQPTHRASCSIRNIEREDPMAEERTTRGRS